MNGLNPLGRLAGVAVLLNLAANAPAPAETRVPGAAEVAASREGLRALIPITGAPEPVAEVRALSIAAKQPERQVPVRLYVPQGVDGAKGLPMILFVHGGGFIAGDLDTHDVLARGLANRTRALVLAIDYRLAPENPFPAGLDDVYAVLQWADANSQEIGGDRRRIAVSGDSAGGNIAAVVAMLARDRGGPAIVAQLLMYPTVSNKMDTHSWATLGDTRIPTRTVNESVIAAYVPRTMSPYAPLVAPLWGDHKNLPPALIQVGDLDPLSDEDRGYAAALTKAGVEAKVIVYPKTEHGFIQFYKDRAHNPAGEQALNEGAAFLRGKFGAP